MGRSSDGRDAAHRTARHPDQDFEFTDADAEADLAAWRAECAISRAIVAAAPSLDSTGTRIQAGEPFSLRWLMLRMIA